MIIEGICNLLFGIVNGLLSLLPDISTAEISVLKFTSFFEFIDVVGYLLPMGTVVTVLGLVVAFGVFRIFVSLIRLVMAFIPFMGG